MLEQPHFMINDPHVLREVIRRHPWATLVSSVNGELVVSHLPVLPAERQDQEEGKRVHEVPVVGHLAKADAELHQLGQHSAVLIVQGPHGYLSPSWYDDGPHVPTWNFVVLHLHGRPTILDAPDTLQVLTRTVNHLESGQCPPWRLDTVTDHTNRLLPATTGFVMSPHRVVGKAKLSQDQTPDVAIRLAEAVDASTAWPSRSTGLAEALRYLYPSPEER